MISPILQVRKLKLKELCLGSHSQEFVDLSKGVRIEGNFDLDKQTQQGEHKVLDKDQMVENCLEGSCDIESVMKMEFPQIHIPLILFPMEAFLQLVCLFFTGNHTGYDLLGRQMRNGTPKHR